MGITKYNKEVILRYARAGYTAADLASELKISIPLANQILHASGVPPRTHSSYKRNR